MVSKLNVRPFHNVNSPLVEPVSTRRPSGVHCRSQKAKVMTNARGQGTGVKWLTATTFTGNLILFVEVCTNLVQIEVEELFRYAFGGNNCLNKLCLAIECILFPENKGSTHIYNVSWTRSKVWDVRRVGTHFS